MSLRRTAAPVALLAAALLIATPALAAPTPDAGTGVQLRQALAHWWADATAGLHTFFAPHGHTVDPNGEPTSLTDASRQTVDPDGEPSALPEHDPSPSPASRQAVDPNG